MKFKHRNNDDMRLLEAYAKGEISKEELMQKGKGELIQQLDSKPMFKVYIDSGDHALLNGVRLTDEEYKEYKNRDAAGKIYPVSFNNELHVQIVKASEIEKTTNN